MTLHARRIALLIGISLPGLAQAQAPQTQTNSVASDTSGEIVVTATRSAEVLSRVPISVSAFSQETMDIKNVRSMEDIARFTPGVSFNRGSNGITIRGIAPNGGSGTTGIYIDDTPVQMRALGFNADDSRPAVFDLERVEILRGPQGTLFGAGSVGGTVRYITPQPGLKDYSVYSRAEISTIAHGGMNYEAGAAVGGPIIEDRIGFRISAYHRRDGGYVDHVDNQSGEVDDKNINYGDVDVMRGALAFKPTDDILITPSIFYQRRTGNASDTWFEGLSDPGKGQFRTSSPEYRGNKDRFYLPAINVQWDFGTTARLVSNTSWYHRDNYTGYDGTIYDLGYYQEEYKSYMEDQGLDPVFYPFLTPTGPNKDLPYYLSPSLVTNRQRSFTQEVRLQSNDSSSRLQWVVGLFYQRSRQTSIEELIDPLGDTLFNATFGMTVEDYFEWPYYGRDSYISYTAATDTQLAGFADLTYAITDRLKVTAGARYSKTKFSFNNFADGSQNAERAEARGKSSEKPFTPKLGVNFQADPNNLFYASWAKGFRPAGANPPVPVSVCEAGLERLGLSSAPASYASDKVRSIELGSKNRIGGKLSIAASVYDIRWSGIQSRLTVPVCAIAFTGNFGTARSRGFDLQATVTPFRGLTIDSAFGYTDAHYTETVQFVGTRTRTVVNKGNALGVPPWSASVGAQYNFTAAAHDFFLRGDFQYTGPLHRLTPNRDPGVATYDPTNLYTASRTFVGLRAGVQLGDVNAALFVDNLMDSHPRVGRTAAGDQDPLADGPALWGTYLYTRTTVRPRTMGLTLTYRR
ncbi:TonB-dependent receptor [Sphingomonas quercus]|uniref:TonB-dependent receptor n=1 Tax=Sphingomonas quercus TaxID=2842451 RepID=A0ABS6BHZ1_9SPHN|nr:TonB-dependent receptor [Sphingomonas quercus]MBU3077924.1 TonB-dependent receptor [Sphingomonas quercus]